AAMLVSAAGLAAARDGFDGTKAGEERTMAGVRLCWCPPGGVLVGRPPDEPGRRPGEGQGEGGPTPARSAGGHGARRGGVGGGAGGPGCRGGTTAPSATSTSPRGRRSAGSSPSWP